MIVCLLPMFISIVVVIPAILFTRLNKNKLKLKSIHILYSFSLLYNEYKPEKYFWEFVKIY